MDVSGHNQEYTYLGLNQKCDFCEHAVENLLIDIGNCTHIPAQIIKRNLKNENQCNARKFITKLFSSQKTFNAPTIE